MTRPRPKFEQLVQWLADEMIWNWTRAGSDRAAADTVLEKMADLKLIRHTEHKFGGNVWHLNGRRYGRTRDD